MQVVIALIVTPEGFPVAYEVMPGNTSDRTTLPAFLRKIETQYGKMNRLWLMDRGFRATPSRKMIFNSCCISSASPCPNSLHPGSKNCGKNVGQTFDRKLSKH